MKYSLFFLLLGVAFSGCESPKKSTVQPPNIIYILADDLGYGELGAYGQEKIKTPNLDRLAASGMRFTQHYTGAPVCAPSRYMFLTGTHAGHAYIRGNYELGQFEDENEGGQMPIPESTPTLAKMLKKAGYQTAMIGKWGLGMNATTGSPLVQGFDYYYGYLDQKQAHNYYPTHLWENDTAVPLNNDYFLVHSPIKEGSDQAAFDQFKDDDYAPDRMIGKALHFLDTTSVEKPFLLYYPTPIPHVSLQVPDSLVQHYQDEFEETPYFGNKGYTAHQYPRAAYAAMITHLDTEVGKIWEAVKERGQEENTLILFTSDNGPTFAGGVEAEYFNSAAGFRGLKMDVYEGGIRIPFIAYWKGKIKPGTVSDLITGHWDMYNTFAALSGQSQSAPDGISILPEMLGKEGQQEHDYIYFEYPEKRGQIALRMGDWKGVKVEMKINPNATWELYNLKKDPQERENLALQYPEIVLQIDSLQRIAHRHPHIREWEFIDPKFKK
ncbi:arylsulfatase [Flavobacteriaceae bacterium]|nr:arylsulfatase [Flavobacteriaceae bacterium]